MKRLNGVKIMNLMFQHLLDDPYEQNSRSRQE